MGPVKYAIFLIISLITAKENSLIPLSLSTRSKTTWQNHWYIGSGQKKCRYVCQDAHHECDSSQFYNMTLEKAALVAENLGVNCQSWAEHSSKWDALSYKPDSNECFWSKMAYCTSYVYPGEEAICPCKIDHAEHKSCSANPLEGTPINTFANRDEALEACNNNPQCRGFQDRSCDGVFQRGGDDYFLCGARDTWADSTTSCIISTPTPSPTYYDPWGSLSEVLNVVTQKQHQSEDIDEGESPA